MQNLFSGRYMPMLMSIRERIVVGMTENLFFKQTDDRGVASKIVHLAIGEYRKNFWTMEPPVISF